MSAYQDRVIADGATGYWPLDDAAGSTSARNLAGPAGTLQPGVTCGAAGPRADGPTAMHFDGTGGITTTPIPLPSAVTLEAWMTVIDDNDRQDEHFIYEHHASSGDPTVRLGLYYSFDGTYKAVPRLVVRIFNDGTQSIDLRDSVPDLRGSGWHHVVGVLTATTMDLYLDGVWVDPMSSAPAAPGHPNPSSGGQAGIGGINFGQGAPWFGDVADVAIYPRVLTAQEIADHFALRTAPEPVPVPDAYANFAYSTVASAPNPPTSGTALIVALGEGVRYPVPPFNVVVCPVDALPKVTNAEILRVTAIAGDTLTVDRAQEGTLARAILVGDQIYASITKKTLDDLLAAVTEGPPGPPGPEGAPGASTSIFYWKADPNSQAANDPGTGKVRWNADPQTNATALYFDRLTSRGLDVTAIFTAMHFSPRLLIQDVDFALNYQAWDMTGPAISHPDWFEVPVVFVEANGQSRFSNNQELAFVVQAEGAVGAPGPPGPQGPAGATGPQGPAGSNATLPTAAVGQVLVSQGAGVQPILSPDLVLTKAGTTGLVLIDSSGTPNIRRWHLRIAGTDLVLERETDAGASAAQGFTISAYNGNVWISGALSVQSYLQTYQYLLAVPATLASLPTSPPVGALANITDCASFTVGGPASGGGTYKALVRWDGVNWVILYSSPNAGNPNLYTTTLVVMGAASINGRCSAAIFESPERTLAGAGAGTSVGALVNVSDSTTNVPGAVVAGGGTFHILARWNGTNWIVIGG